MSDESDSTDWSVPTLYICVFMFIVLDEGEPSLLDAVIHYLMK